MCVPDSVCAKAVERAPGWGVKRQILMRPSSGVSICLLRQAAGDSAGGRQGCVCVCVSVCMCVGGCER